MEIDEKDGNEFAEETASEPHSCTTCQSRFSTPKMLNKHNQICWNSSTPNSSKSQQPGNSNSLEEKYSPGENLEDSMYDFDEDDELTEGETLWQCKHCDNRSFKTLRAFAIHSAKAHNKKIRTSYAQNADSSKKLKASTSFSKRGKGFAKKRNSFFKSPMKQRLSFKKESNYDDEESTSKEKKSFQCSLCTSCFLYKKCLTNHIENIHQDSMLTTNYKEMLDEEAAKWDESNMDQELMDTVNSESMPEIICIQCVKTFVSQIHLEEHTNIYHPNMPTDLPTSLQLFSMENDESDLLEEGYIYKCDVCSLAFNVKKQYDDHIKARHSPTPSQNSYNQDLEDSLLDSNGMESGYSCEICNVGFKFLKRLDNHNVRVHSSIIQAKNGSASPFTEQMEDAPSENVKANSFYGVRRNFACELCDRTFKSMKNLKMHKRFHFKSKNNINGEGTSENKIHITPQKNDKMHKGQISDIINCSYCPKKFNDRPAFASHMKKMHPEMIESDDPTKFTCNVCLVKFDNFELWASHYKRYYYTLKRFAWCTVCYERFLSSEGLKGHQKQFNHFPVLADLPCPFCDSKFPSNKSLFLHVPSHTEKGLEMKSFLEQIYCNLCKISFSNPEDNKKHLELKHNNDFVLPDDDHNSDEPSQGDSELSILMSPVISPKSLSKSSPNSYCCIFCDKKFASALRWANHFLEYTNKIKGPYVCGVCDETFDLHSLFERHQRQTSHFESEDIPVCSICSKTFNNLKKKNYHYLQHLPKHAELVKKKLEESLCKYCYTPFNKFSELTTHFNNAHAEEVKAEKEKALRLLMNDNHAVHSEENIEIQEVLNLDPTFSITEPVEILPGKIFQCHLCWVSHMKSYETVVKHTKTAEHHSKEGSQPNAEDLRRRVTCSCCHVSKGPVSAFVFHRLDHFKTDQMKNMLLSENNPFICEICSSMFTTEETACEHLLSHVFVRTTTKVTMDSPYKSSLSKNPISNSLSKKPSPKNALFRSPSRAVKKELICMQCRQEFVSASELALHTRKDCLTRKKCSKCQLEFPPGKSYLSHYCPKKSMKDCEPYGNSFPSSQGLVKRPRHSKNNSELENSHSSNKNHKMGHNHNRLSQPSGSRSFPTGSNCSECDKCKQIKQLLEEHLSSHDNLEVLYENIKPSFGNFRNIFVKEETSSSDLLLRQNFADLLNLVVANPVVLNLLGFKEKPIEEVLVSLLKSLEVIPEMDEAVAPMDRFKANIQMFIDCCIKDEVMNMVREGNPDFYEMVRKTKTKFLEEHVNKLTRRDLFM